MTTSPAIDIARLLGRLDTFNQIGALPSGGNCRLALSDEDRAGRDLLVKWMREVGLTVTIDAIGNIIGVRVAVGPAPYCASTNVRVDAIMMKMAADAAAIERLQIIAT